MKKTTTYFFSKNKRKSFHFSVLSLPWCSGRFFVSSLLEIPPPPSLLPSSQWSPPSPSRVSSSEGGKSGWRGVRGGRGDATKRKKRRSSPSPSSVFLARVYLRKEKKKTTRRRRRRKAHSQKVGLAATALLCAKNSKKFIPPPPLFERVGRGIQSYPSSSSSAIPFAYFFLLEPFSTSHDLSRKKYHLRTRGGRETKGAFLPRRK